MVLRIVAWREDGATLHALVQKTIPSAARSFQEKGVGQGEYVLNLHGFRTTNSAYMMAVPIRYNPV